MPDIDDAAIVVVTTAAAEALGQTVIIKLNGGLGTSMGLDSAKTLLPVRNGKNFLDLIVEQVRYAHGRHANNVGKSCLGQAEFIEYFAQKFARVNGWQARLAYPGNSRVSDWLGGAHSFQETAGRSPFCSASAIRFRMVSAVSVRARYRASDSVSASKW